MKKSPVPVCAELFFLFLHKSGGLVNRVDDFGKYIGIIFLYSVADAHTQRDYTPLTVKKAAVRYNIYSTCCAGIFEIGLFNTIFIG